MGNVVFIGGGWIIDGVGDVCGGLIILDGREGFIGFFRVRGGSYDRR